MDEIFKAWLAGLIDGDGCFSIPVGERYGKVSITHQVRIALKENDDWILKEIQEKTNIGKVYYSNKGKDNGICSWQTTSYIDSITIVELLIPYLKLKKEKAIKFLKAVKLLEDTKKRGNGIKATGKYMRKQDALLEVIQIATTLNNDRQTKRYRDYKNFEYWKKKVEETYN